MFYVNFLEAIVIHCQAFSGAEFHKPSILPTPEVRIEERCLCQIYLMNIVGSRL